MTDTKKMTVEEAIEIVKRRIQEGYPTRLSLRRELAHALATLEALVESEAGLRTENERLKKERTDYMTYEEYIHSELPEIEAAENEAQYGPKPFSRRKHCYEVFPCPREDENAALKAEVERLTRIIHQASRLSTLIEELMLYKTRAEKAEAELSSLRSELDAARPFIEAVMSVDLEKIREADDDGMIISAFMECGPFIKAALAYREGKEKP